ncbi:hypothetical protein MMC26_001917 [Xylographa opegraphella]|nr:hypothetical protein [Xylographa opegraphella]
MEPRSHAVPDARKAEEMGRPRQSSPTVFYTIHDQLLRALAPEAVLAAPNGIPERLAEEQKARKLFQFADDRWREENYSFKTFERLVLFDLFRYQQQLVELEGRVVDAQGASSADELDWLRTLLREYQDALYRWNRTMGFKEPPPLDMAQDMTLIAKKLQEPNYVLHVDSMAGVDLSTEVEANRIRSITQALRSSRLVVSAMRHYRQYWSMSTATRYQLLLKLLNVLNAERTPSRTSPIIRGLAKFFMAIVGSVLLIIPNIVLLFMVNVNRLLALGFVLAMAVLFSALLGIFTTAKGQELVALSAAYMAVLLTVVASIGPYQS